MNSSRALNAPWLTSGPTSRVLQLLNDNGEEARVVGGAVRNALLDIPCGDIDVAARNIQQRVADRAADHARLLAVVVQKLQHTRGRTGGKPGRVQRPRTVHFSTPGTSLPFSICAGI